MDTFGPYRLDVLLGQGGMGEVWRAYDTTKDRAVALKRLPSQLAENPEFQTRFRREAKIAAQLREPHIIPIHDYGEIDGQLFLDMRLVDGVDLASSLTQFGPLHPVRAVEITSQIASALDAAHAAGLIHRDVKPSNVLLTGPGPEWNFAYLIDFGISYAADDTRITHTSAGAGTPAYLAPERYFGHSDKRADVYALGGLLHTMLTGTSPFPGDGPTQMYAHIHTPPPAPSRLRAELPSGLDEVVATAMAKEPDHRYPSAGALATAAREALTTPIRPRNPAVPDQRLDDPHAPAAAAPAGQRALIPPPRTRTPVLRTPGRRTWLVLLSVALIIAFVGTAIALLRPAGATSRANPSNTVTATIPVGQYPNGVALTPDGRHAYVANNDTVSLIDTATNTVTVTIPVGPYPEGNGAEYVAITPDGRHAYVTCNSSDAVSVIDTVSNTVTATVPLPGPIGVAVAPDGRHAYVAVTAAVSVIDTATNGVTATIPTAQWPTSVAVAPDGRHVYVSSNGSGTVSVIDTATNTTTATIRTSQVSTVDGGPFGVAVAPDGRHAYVINNIAGTVSVIDTATNTVTATIPVGSNPLFGVAITPDGRHAYVANSGSNTVSVIDTATNTVTATIGVGERPRHVTVARDGRHAYVTNEVGNTVSVISTGAG